MKCRRCGEDPSKLNIKVLRAERVEPSEKYTTIYRITEEKKPNVPCPECGADDEPKTIKADDIGVSFHCPFGHEQGFACWTMRDAINQGGPICYECGADLVIDDEQDEYMLVKEA